MLEEEVKVVSERVVEGCLLNALKLQNQRTNGPVNAHLRPEIYIYIYIYIYLPINLFD